MQGKTETKMVRTVAAREMKRPASRFSDSLVPSSTLLECHFTQIVFHHAATVGAKSFCKEQRLPLLPCNGDLWANFVFAI